MRNIFLAAWICWHCLTPSFAQKSSGQIKLIPVDSGWAKNSVNAIAFRKNSLVSFQNFQFISFYNASGKVVVGKREHGSDQWDLAVTPFHGNCVDAHNSISIAADGDGYIHLAWDHHNSPLRYARSIAPLSLNFKEERMTGLDELKVTYPEFYRLKNKNLLFLYRNGESGSGKLVMNEFDVKTRTWHQLNNNLIDGENQRNAYWQCYVDSKGTIHLSWVWRESPDVASNHDMCYAQSRDNGRTWMNSKKVKYTIPITAATAEYAWRIPEMSELINQTSMGADRKGNPFIVSYYREKDSAVPQYQLLWRNKRQWKHIPFSFRTTPFSLSGMGTKRIPMARPQILVGGKRKNASVLVLFRDEERGNKVSIISIDRIGRNDVSIRDLSPLDVGSWEPTIDTERWKKKKELHLFVQRVDQADAEGLSQNRSEMVYVLEWVSL